MAEVAVARHLLRPPQVAGARDYLDQAAAPLVRLLERLAQTMVFPVVALR
jgi:hypothetical protein